MNIEITQEMLEAARRKRESESQIYDIEDPGEQNICIGCE